MTLIAQHPLYKLFTTDWETMRDCYAGERTVKERGMKYLPATSGMVLDGMSPNQKGWAAYNAYRGRAVFHDFVKDGVLYYIGMMYQKPPSINIPKKLEPMRDCATLQHEGLEQLLRKVNEQQLVAGRFGLMLDMPTNPIVTPERPLLPYIATYNAEAITNWDVGTRDEIDVPKLNMVVLDESGYKRVGQFEWKMQKAYRVLGLGQFEEDEAKGLYMQALFSGEEVTFDASQMFAPNIMGKTLDEIPFAFVNAQDNLPHPDYPPLLGLANIALAIYRGEADYRQNLFMQGQDTLVVIGGKDEDTYRTGAGSVINLRPGQGGVDAKFIGVTATGLAEQRQALENDKMAARNKSGSLIDTRSKAKESGEALATRVAAQAATLNALGNAGAKALEYILKCAAKWVGADPEEVEVQPNTEYTEEQFLAADLQALVAAKNQGAPLSWETIHDIMLERGMTQLSYEEELERMENEGPSIIGTDAGGNPVDDVGRSLDPLTMQPINGPGPKKPVSDQNAPDEEDDPRAAKPKAKKVSSRLAAQKPRTKPKPAKK